MFRNKDYARQLKDFSGLRWKSISPTDIDALLEFNNKLFILVETKFRDAPIPYGQLLALERVAGCIKDTGKAAIVCVTSHNEEGDIDMAQTIVRQYWENGAWEKEVPEINLKDFVDLMRGKYLGRVS